MFDISMIFYETNKTNQYIFPKVFDSLSFFTFEFYQPITAQLPTKDVNISKNNTKNANFCNVNMGRF